jgi:hypothetical protein
MRHVVAARDFLASLRLEGLRATSNGDHHMPLKTSIALAAILLATPVLAQDQTRQQDRVRDPSTHADGSSGPQRDQTRDRLHESSQERSRERSRAANGGGAGKGGSGSGGSGSGSSYRGGR